MLFAYTCFVLVTGFLLGAFAVAGVFAYLVRQNEMEKHLDIDMPKQKPATEPFDQEKSKHTILAYN